MSQKFSNELVNMKILAVDTAAVSCSVAVADDASLLAEITLERKQTHSKHLMTLIQTILKMSGLSSISEIDGFAVVQGPGSFTGLRIGMSIIKGLAAGTGKPVAGISTLDALAYQFSFFPHQVQPLMDARKGEVYTCIYKFENGILIKETDERVASPEEAISDIRDPRLFVGSGALLYKDIIWEKAKELACFIAPPQQHVLRASTVAQLAWMKFEKNDVDDVAALVPGYIRKSDAELGFGKKVVSSVH